METLQQRLETWARGQGSRIRRSWPRWRWPLWPGIAGGGGGKEERRKMQEELRRRKQQLQNLSRAVQADSLADLQDVPVAKPRPGHPGHVPGVSCPGRKIFAATSTARPQDDVTYCIQSLAKRLVKTQNWTRPSSELVRAVNKFKADFGGQVVSLERVQPSLDHVPHRYLLAEAGDTLFASFIGTKQYRDVIADANILQGAIFHEDVAGDVEEQEANVNDQNDANSMRENPERPLKVGLNSKSKSRPAAHRGFLARAKGIPALELYRLAQRKNRRLVLCGHSLGGAVAVLATLAILRVVGSATLSKETNKVDIKCITFSQPPVGNASLRDYVHRKEWQNYFKTYCIPEDLVPRILSPAYFHHYSSNKFQNLEDVSSGTTRGKDEFEEVKNVKLKENEGEQMVLGLGPTPTKGPFWRLSRLVPLEGVHKQLDWFKRGRQQSGETSLVTDSNLNSMDEMDSDSAPKFLEIQEGSDVISLKPFPHSRKDALDEIKGTHTTARDHKSVESPSWHRVPSLPSYVPFGQLYLLRNSSAESLSVSEYSKLTSVRSVFTELRDRLQSHSMKSYRARFQKIYDLCMCDNPPPLLGMEQLQQFPHLQQWLGLAVAGVVELGNIVEPPVIRTPTSIVPLGWNDASGRKNGNQGLKVDIYGYGLHLCTLFQSQVDNTWCTTTVESSSLAPACSVHDNQTDLQKLRLLVGPPLRQASKQQPVADPLSCGSVSSNDTPVDTSFRTNPIFPFEQHNLFVDGLSSFTVHCTSDFFTVSKEVHVRARRVHLLGLEGAGKTSLYNAIMGHNQSIITNLESLQTDLKPKEGITGGVCYSDSEGVNLQDLKSEARHLREELWMGTRYLSRKIDLIVLVHNLSHRIPKYHQPESTQNQPALSLLLNEATEVGIPWILAITNIFSLGADQKNSAINSVLQAYQPPSDMAVAVNSCPYVMPSSAIISQGWISSEGGEGDTQKRILPPMSFVRMPFQKKPTVLPVEGINSLRQLIHRVLSTCEEASFEELARERLYIETLREQLRAEARKDAQDKGGSMTAAAVGASLGAGLGLVLAVVMGAASALRKP